MTFEDAMEKLCDAERERLVMAEIGIDEILTTMDRHGVWSQDPMYLKFVALSQALSRRNLATQGGFDYRERLIRVRDKLTKAFPLSDADLKQSNAVG